MSTKRQIGLIITTAAVVVAASILLTKNQNEKNVPPKAVIFAEQTTPAKTFALTTPIADPVALTFAVTPTDPTTNPTEPYNPMPLRVGTVGAAIFHRPFCPYAKQSLANHGLIKRINYWTREQVAEARRRADDFCLAGVFDCSDVSPTDFMNSGNDPWCGANISRRNYDMIGLDEAIAGKTLCNIQGYIGVFVDDLSHCIGGKIKGSLPTCNSGACSVCREDITQDCTSSCTDCIIVTMAPINKITFGLGDANKDGELNIDDYLYYHECYSGPSIAATDPCINVFDWDEDGDVDVDDFSNFVFSYESGNQSWADTTYPPASFPETVINPERSPLPLRVGTEGATYYHRLDCPSVNASWSTHGLEKRTDYYTWDQIENSGRISDGRICFAGTRDNPSGSWQDCTLDNDGDGTLNCDDTCPEDLNKTDPGVCGCGKSEPAVAGDPCP